ncbi:hypothetical protein [Ligilactobacillus aviarius]|uniref:Uncharacterized protein n=1 Tax=Ligilactobacillus aviarius TaxID=1606 RepID=A0A510WQ35_9LACO|nr:hypothetical protein [Ligilactobacillus aviarius]KRM38332.1 hypothetical protein FC33_GL000412 [Ligilactobacillus aviarius subsp. aviarius DSM 20655]GEK41328.1 hypothetical protein LAV01_01600 [Ligilactobacillus aviarius]
MFDEEEIFRELDEEEKKKPKKQRLEEEKAIYERLKKGCERQINRLKKEIENL